MTGDMLGIPEELNRLAVNISSDGILILSKLPPTMSVVVYYAILFHCHMHGIKYANYKSTYRTFGKYGASPKPCFYACHQYFV